MSEMAIAAWVAIAITAVLMCGVPITFGLTAVAVLFMLVFAGPASLVAVPRVFFEEVNGFALMAIPMFILLGAAVGSSRASADIYEAAHRWLRVVPGGLVVANIVACGIFSAICGSSPATAAAIGKAGIPQMRARGVSDRLASGAICAGGTLGILIPPSITLIIYGIATETSISRLFLAGVVPGLILVVLFSLYAVAISFRSHAAEQSQKKQHVASDTRGTFLRAAPLLSIIVVVLIAMYGGFATPSEIAGLAALLAVVMVAVIYRLSLSQWRSVAAELVRDTSMVMMMIAASGLFSYMLSLLYITQSFGEYLVGANLAPLAFLLGVSVFLLVAGCFLPPVALILMVMPIVQPALEIHRVDLIWFGIIMTILMEIGLITPPVGVNLFVIRGIAPDIPLRSILEGSLPFVLIMIASIALFYVYPDLILWLPNRVMGL